MLESFVNELAMYEAFAKDSPILLDPLELERLLVEDIRFDPHELERLLGEDIPTKFAPKFSLKQPVHYKIKGTLELFRITAIFPDGSVTMYTVKDLHGKRTRKNVPENELVAVPEQYHQPRECTQNQDVKLAPHRKSKRIKKHGI